MLLTQQKSSYIFINCPPPLSPITVITHPLGAILHSVATIAGLQSAVIHIYFSSSSRRRAPYTDNPTCRVEEPEEAAKRREGEREMTAHHVLARHCARIPAFVAVTLFLTDTRYIFNLA
jgi:hypothetical protein